MRLVFALLLTAFAGCASTMPQGRATATIGQGELVEGCKNVADNAKGVRPKPDRYHTTWASAWAEGASAGVQEGLVGKGAAYDAVANSLANPVSDDGDPVFQDGMLGVRPFCRVFASDRRTVAELVDDVLFELGNPIKLSDIESGIFQTELVSKENFAAKWKDDFIVTVTEERTNRVVVRVLRNVYISRQGSAYHQAQSDGQIEAWVLMQVQNALTPSNR